jgi:hypothetical protein
MPWCGLLQVLLELSSTVEQGELSYLPEKLQNRKPGLKQFESRTYGAKAIQDADVTRSGRKPGNNDFDGLSKFYD